ncbi:hypothetical protein ACH5RR_039191 [Cinchona calisaya]|uniref:Uncharacterized protein n=1 Tax=Cinchona calisaya TaxID=153742 RepID=A0ABD2XY26_9GENT
MKLHLAGERGSVVPCTKVAPEVRHAILGSLKEYAQKAKEKMGDFREENPYGRSVNDFDGDDIQEIPPPRAKGVSINMTGASTNKGKRKATIEVTNGLLDYIEKYVDWCDHAKFTHEIAMFREREGSFGRKLALNTSRTDRPEFWVVEEEPAGELDYGELEADLEELPVDDDVECFNFQ